MKIDYYDELRENEENSFWLQSKKNLVLSLSPIRIGRALDCGAGTGLIGDELNKIGWGVTFLEPERKCLNWIKQRMKGRQNYNIVENKIADYRGINHFDLAIASEVLEHIDEDVMALKIIHNSLKKGGKIIITIPQHTSLWSEHDLFCKHKRRYERKEIIKKMRQAGFKKIKLRNWNMLAYVYRKVFDNKKDYPKNTLLLKEIMNNVARIYFHLIEKNIDFGVGVSLIITAEKGLG